MSEIQVIEYNGRTAAIVFGGHVVLADGLQGRERRHVQAMALYALEVVAGDRPGAVV